MSLHLTKQQNLTIEKLDLDHVQHFAREIICYSTKTHSEHEMLM